MKSSLGLLSIAKKNSGPMKRPLLSFVLNLQRATYFFKRIEARETANQLVRDFVDENDLGSATFASWYP